jgi:hypothetical protein
MENIYRWIQRIVNSRYVNLLVALGLLVTSLHEMWSTLHADLLHLHLKAAHGVAAYGLFQVLKTIPDFIKAGKDIEEASKDIEGDTQKLKT